LTDENGAAILVKEYQPYGSVLNTTDDRATNYGYTNEYTSQGLIYLRARYYDPAVGRFLTKDSWAGNYNHPMTYNGWAYVENNPTNFTDPSGKTATGFNNSDLTECITSKQLAGVDYSVRIDVCKMIPKLEDAGFYEDTPDQDHISGGYRDPETAHRVSTAYHIIHDLVSIDDLRNVPKDMDGNIWFKDEWKYLFPDCRNVNIVRDWLLVAHQKSFGA